MNYQKLIDQLSPEEARSTYERLLRQLYQLEEQGLDQTDAADVIREQMDIPWYAMTSEDQDAMVDLSITLRSQL